MDPKKLPHSLQLPFEQAATILRVGIHLLSDDPGDCILCLTLYQTFIYYDLICFSINIIEFLWG